MERNYAWYSSLETMGALDGPGLRLVIFLQGCPLRCLFCHNPETIAYKEEKKITVDEVLELYRKNESFYKNGGGITISGGESIAQPDFLISLLTKTKELGIHTALDTAAGPFMGKKIDKLKKVVELADLFIVDIKHPDTEICRELTGMGNENQYDFLSYLESVNQAFWVRHVFVPTYSDRKPDSMNQLGQDIGLYKNMERFEILPYHNMMIPKYEEQGIPFKLYGIEPPTEARIAEIMIEINKGIDSVRKAK